MNGPIQPSVPKAELLERERRWSRPAGIAALLGVGLAVVSVALQQSAVGANDDTDAERLVNIHENAGEFFLSNVLQGLAFLLFAAPLWFLFRAAQGRAPQVRTGFAMLAIVGPALLFTSQVVSAVGFTDVADKFDEELPSLEQQGGGQARQGEADSTETGTTTGDGDEDPEENTPKEDRAEDLVSESGAVNAGGILSLPGFLAFVIGMVYIPLWAMRTGLLTRFWGSLGMAIGVVVVLIPPAQLALILWMAAIGLMLIGIWPGSRPPAWEAGAAMPWPKPGEPPPTPGAPDDTVEGSGREVSEMPLPEGAPEQPPEEPGPPYGGETPDQPRRKRKRRS
jgi:hypothetical protein